MMPYQEERILAYVNGTLKGDDLKKMNQAIEQDAALAEEVRLRLHLKRIKEKAHFLDVAARMQALILANPFPAEANPEQEQPDLEVQSPQNEPVSTPSELPQPQNQPISPPMPAEPILTPRVSWLKGAGAKAAGVVLGIGIMAATGLWYQGARFQNGTFGWNEQDFFAKRAKFYLDNLPDRGVYGTQMTPDTQLNKALSFYRAKQFREAEPIFNQIRANETEQTEEMDLYLAVCRLRIGDYKGVRQLLNQGEPDASTQLSLFAQKTQMAKNWYLSLAYLASEPTVQNQAKVRELLAKVVQANDADYGEAAQTLLKELKE